MKRLDPDNRGHSSKRGALRVAGFAATGAGVVLTVIGLVSFFAAFGSSAIPKYFWCAFIGLPLMGVGFMMLKVAYLGTIARYVANEAAPVGRDTFNYMADGTKEGVRTVSSAVGQGFREGFSGERAPAAVACPHCGADNDADAKFCDGCGQPLPREKTCPACNETNDADARFCDNCGAGLA